MSKLPKKHQFLDLSDYGRYIAKIIAKKLETTSFTPVDVTLAFVISGLIGLYCITLRKTKKCKYTLLYLQSSVWCF